MDTAQESKIIDLIIRLLLVGLFLYSALVMVAPLVSVVIWAAVMSISLYPMFDRLQALLGGRKSIAATLLVLLGLAVTLGPIAVGVSATIDLVTRFSEAASAGQIDIPPPPEGLRDIPLVGTQIAEVWSLFDRNLSLAVQTYGGEIKNVTVGLFGTVANVALGLLGLALSAIVMGALLPSGPQTGQRLQTLANRIFAPRGGEYVTLAGTTIRNVTKGVIGVAALQALAVWVCLYAFGIPSAAALAFICFVLSVVQLGPGLVLLPLAIYAWNTMSGGAALAFTVLAIPLTFGDSVLRPVMISKGLDTPIMVIILGVIGGVMAYGLIGIFLGPVLMAVFFELSKLWMQADRAKPGDAATEAHAQGAD